MASAEDSRTSKRINEKSFLQENEDIGSCYRSVSSASGSSIEKFFLQEHMDTSSCHSKDFSVSSPEGSVANMIHKERAVLESTIMPSECTIGNPRFNNQTLRDQIRLARLRIAEKTKLRDAIEVQIQEKRANSQIHGLDYEYAKSEERSVQKLVKSKRMEIENLLFVINQAKNALAIKDVDIQISNMEHMIRHQTLILGKEKQLIQEIKQLKLLREQLYPSLGNADEIQRALKQREAAETCLKFLRKELNVLKDSVSKAEATAWQAGKKFSDENKKLNELQLQLRAASGDLQVAYSQWQSLWNALCNKNKPICKCEDDTAVASNYQAENFAGLWNMNDEFHQEDVKFNAMDTIGHIKSLIPQVHVTDERVEGMDLSSHKVNSLSQNPTRELKQEATVEHVIRDDKLIMEVPDDTNQTGIDERPPGSVSGNGLFMVSSQDATDDFKQVPKESEEATESNNTTEEMLWDAEHEAKLKEKSRLEEAAKANEVHERKKQQAKKIQMRKELRAQKEAEQQEKKREKRSRKKEKQMAAAATDSNDTYSHKNMPSVEPKKPLQKTSAFTKQISKVRYVPPPLRIRNKKMYRRWMWMFLVSLVLSIIFWHGTVDVLTSAKLYRQ